VSASISSSRWVSTPIWTWGGGAALPVDRLAAVVELTERLDPGLDLLLGVLELGGRTFGPLELRGADGVLVGGCDGVRRRGCPFGRAVLDGDRERPDLRVTLDVELAAESRWGGRRGQRLGRSGEDRRRGDALRLLGDVGVEVRGPALPEDVGVAGVGQVELGRRLVHRVLARGQQVRDETEHDGHPQHQPPVAPDGGQDRGPVGPALRFGWTHGPTRWVVGRVDRAPTERVPVGRIAAGNAQLAYRPTWQLSLNSGPGR
jgi:hypothetical protein